MTNLFGGEGSRSISRRGGDKPSRRHQPASKLWVSLTVCYALVVILAGALLTTDGLISTANLGLGAGALAGPLAMAGVAKRRRRTAEPLPMMDLSELSLRIGTAMVEIAPVHPTTSGDESAHALTRPLKSDLASLYDLHLFAVLGLPRLQAARDNGSRCSIVVLGVDTWSRYDAPVASDARLPLEGVAKAIRRHVRTQDIAARYGDDEFVIFLDKCDRDEAQRIVDRLSRSVVELATAAGRLSLSAGIAVFPDCGVDMHSLIQRADSVLRDIRATGRSEVRLVVPEWTPGVAMQSALA